MRGKIKSFQELRNIFFLVSIAVGGYPPGTTEYLKSKTLQWFFYCMGLIPYFATIAYCCGLTYHIIFNTPEDPVFLIKLVRRDIIMAYLAIRLGNHLLRYKKTDYIFKRWNEDMNTAYMAEERKIKVEENLLRTAKIAGSGLFLRTLMAELYNVPFIMNRYVISSELAGFPHDNTSSSHFYYVAYQVILFIWIGAAVPPIEMYVLYISALAHTEMDLLKDKLASIMNTLEINKNDELIYNSPKGPVPIEFKSRQYYTIANQVEKDLQKWTNQHIDTLEWIHEICDYLTLDTTCKYVYLAIHCSLVVIGLTGMLALPNFPFVPFPLCIINVTVAIILNAAGRKVLESWLPGISALKIPLQMSGSAMINDLALTLLVTVGNFTVLFYGTRKIDALKVKTNQVALDGYAKGWFLYPQSIQKKMHIITGGAIHSDVTVPVFTIYQDDSENMKAVINLAYSALTFILPMTAGK